MKLVFEPDERRDIEFSMTAVCELCQVFEESPKSSVALW